MNDLLDLAALLATAPFGPSKQGELDWLRSILEDFDVVGHRVLVSRSEAKPLRAPIEAVLLAQVLRNKSVDYTLRTYVDKKPKALGTDPSAMAQKAYVAAYRAAKAHVLTSLNKLQPIGKPEPTAGQLVASVALERLPYSLFSAHFLYSLGHRFEGHAVSRHILEQIAWAHSAGCLDHLDGIARIVTTKSITALAKFHPAVGKLYGFLSKQTHLDFTSHAEFVRIRADGRGEILLTQRKFLEYAEVILTLADTLVAVWEASQSPFLDKIESVTLDGDSFRLIPNRPFLRQTHKSLQAVSKAEERASKPKSRSK